MEKLIIDIPKGKFQLVKQLLEALGVKIMPFKKTKSDKDILTQVSVWSKNDIKAIEEAGKSINKMDIESW